MRFITLLAVAATLTFTSGLQAQDAQDTDVRDELRTMVTEEGQAADDRAVIVEFLERDDVERVAAEKGLDIERAKDGARTLGSGQAADLARKMLDVEADGALVGGNTVVITTTTIVIILLILILLSV